MTAIDKLIDIAKNEIGYLEKASNSNLYDMTANAGSANYTKYWADIYPKFQGQAWCACFVTWCFVQAFGKDKAAMMLKHYPYTYCPTMASLFTLNANPKKGDIVIFKHNGKFTHTGIVTAVDGDYFAAVEGNTSTRGIIVANGGAVCSKGYYNSELPGTKFCSPDYSIAESEDLTMTQYEELKNEIAELKETVSDRLGYYNYIDENMNIYYRPTIQKLVAKGYLQGNENGELMLTNDMMRLLVMLNRAGVFDVSAIAD